MSKQPRPLSAGSRQTVDADRIKLHRREVGVGPHVYQVLSPRPGTAARWATNRFHETWHIVCDAGGWRLLARLLWGLACEKRPNTLLWLGPDLLQPVPFDQERSRPVFFVPTTVTHIGRDELNRIADALKRHPRPDGTVCCRTWGLNAVAEEYSCGRYVCGHVRTQYEAGAVTVRASALALRDLAQRLAYYPVEEVETTHEYVDDVDWSRREYHWQRDGEIQFYRDFVLISRRTAGARKNILDRQPDPDADALRAAIHKAAPASP